jgi:hypothetical protein
MGFRSDKIQNIPSQIWFFELYKTLMPAKFHAKQLLRAGNYVLQLADDNDYLTVNNRGTVNKQSFRPTYPNGNGTLAI